jgi:hypothetical protein
MESKHFFFGSFIFVLLIILFLKTFVKKNLVIFFHHYDLITRLVPLKVTGGRRDCCQGRKKRRFVITVIFPFRFYVNV